MDKVCRHLRSRTKMVSAYSSLSQPNQIRELAIKKLSIKSTGLSCLEKISLARDHRVGAWLIEGLTSLALGGLRTAFRLAMVRNESLGHSMITPLVIGGSRFAGFSCASLHCVFCVKPFNTGELKCQTCSSSFANHVPGAFYVASDASTAQVLRLDDLGQCFSVPIRDLRCGSCHRRRFVVGTAYSSCGTHSSPVTSIFISLCFKSTSPTHSIDTLIRDAFKDEIRECEM